MKPAMPLPCGVGSGGLNARFRGRRWAWLAALIVPVCLGPVWVGIFGLLWPESTLASATGFVVLLLLAVCTFTDLTWARIPNWATYSAFLWALAINAVGALCLSADELSKSTSGQPTLVSSLGAVGLGQSLLGGLVCFAIMLFIYQMAGGGAGDVKLGAALGALLGVERGVNALVVSYIIAGVATVSWVIWTIGPVILLKSCARKLGRYFFPWWVERPDVQQEQLLQSPVPMAAFFALGTLAVLGGVTIEW